VAYDACVFAPTAGRLLPDRFPARFPARPTGREVALAAGLGLFILVGTFGTEYGPGTRHPDAGAAALVLAIAACLTVRRRHPVPVLTAVWLLTLGYFLARYPFASVWLGLVVAYYTAVVTGHRLAGAVAGVSGFLIFPWLDNVLGRGPAPMPGLLSFIAASLLVVFGLAEGVRVRRQRAAEAARTRAEEAKRQAGEERLRIAQELHDVLAHNISLINVQASVALRVNQQLPEQARTALTAIKQASREGLGELRTVLDVLRQTQDPAAAPGWPAPGLAQVQELVEGAKLAGLDAGVEVEGEPFPLPASVDLAAYRIAQEALTNVIRHANALAVRVRVVYGSDELEIRIEDDGGGPQTEGEESWGNGLSGMRERAAALGGTLDAGPRAGGGFRVRARLPRRLPAEPPR
jgi:signal transduction histidine kinase